MARTCMSTVLVVSGDSVLFFFDLFLALLLFDVEEENEIIGLCKSSSSSVFVHNLFILIKLFLHSGSGCYLFISNNNEYILAFTSNIMVSFNLILCGTSIE